MSKYINKKKRRRDIIEADGTKIDIEHVRCLGFGPEHHFRRRKGDSATRLCGRCRSEKESKARSIAFINGTNPLVDPEV